MTLTEADSAAAASKGDRALDQPVTVTFFRNQYAEEKFERVSSIRGLVPTILAPNKSRKDFLPFVKLGRFGDLRTEKDALRHDANVLSVTGIECDYDGEVIAMEQDAATLRRANVAALLYTSPSHSPEKPRWRVLCPFSQELAPDQRAPMLARLNGVLGGILTPESWTLSQSYYFGSVNHNPAHKVELVEGDFLDLRPDLDATAIGDPSRHSSGGNKSEPYTPASELRATREAVEGALAYIPNADDLSRITWVRIGMAIRAALGEEGRDLWIAFSKSGKKSGKSGKSDTAERTWQSFKPDRIGFGTLYHLATRNGWEPPPDLQFSPDDGVDLSALFPKVTPRVSADVSWLDRL
jgi:hypothetical protein